MGLTVQVFGAASFLLVFLLHGSFWLIPALLMTMAGLAVILLTTQE